MADIKRIVVYDPVRDKDSSITSTGALIVSRDPDAGYTKAISYDALNNLEYLGIAVMGTAKSAGTWQIRKLIYDSNGNLTDMQWADGNDNYDNIWNNRVSLSYS